MWWTLANRKNEAICSSADKMQVLTTSQEIAIHNLSYITYVAS